MKDMFKIKTCKNIKLIILYLCISAAVALASGLLFGYWGTSILSGAFLFAALCVRIEFSDTCPLFVRCIYAFAMSFIIFVLTQRTLSSGISEIGAVKFILNTVIVAGAVFLIWGITGKLKASLIAVNVFCQLFATADNIVARARNMEIQFFDILNIGTAAEVADQYSLSVSMMTRASLVLAGCFTVFIALTGFPRKERSKKQAVCCASGFLLSVLCILGIYFQIGASFVGYVNSYWNVAGSMHNGLFVNFVYTAASSRIVPPEGYDPEKLSAMMEKYLSDDSAESPADCPNVIVIMNESFADVHNIAASLGNGMVTDTDITPFFDSLDDSDPNIIKGHALTSVYGGNTSNAEYEFLSGMSMQFFPRSTVAYSLYLNEDNCFSAVERFSSAGYRTVSIHPEKATNWQRDTVYKYYGFDESLFIDEFSDVSDEDLFRTHISDRAVYQKITELYESKKEGESLFTFAITMQNHGGYLTEGFEPTVIAEGEDPELCEYLSCINDSDAALKELIGHFEKADEKTVILFFGDHQPSISGISSDYYGINGSDKTLEKQADYVVPYLFWANFDLSDESAPALTSLNFLSSELMGFAGVPKAPVDQFIDSLREDISAVNAMGWFDNDLNFCESDYNSPHLNEALTLYAALHYNMLFDSENRITSYYKAP